MESGVNVDYIYYQGICVDGRVSVWLINPSSFFIVSLMFKNVCVGNAGVLNRIRTEHRFRVVKDGADLICICKDVTIRFVSMRATWVLRVADWTIANGNLRKGLLLMICSFIISRDRGSAAQIVRVAFILVVCLSEVLVAVAELIYLRWEDLLTTMDKPFSNEGEVIVFYYSVRLLTIHTWAVVCLQVGWPIDRFAVGRIFEAVAERGDFRVFSYLVVRDRARNWCKRVACGWDVSALYWT